MAQPQGFRTFQILLAIGFLIGFIGLLFFFFWKISQLNTDLDRISIASQVRSEITAILSDGRACELNFSGLVLGRDSVPLRKIINLREEAVLRAKKPVEGSRVNIVSMRAAPRHTDTTEGPGETIFLLDILMNDTSSLRTSNISFEIMATGSYNNREEFSIETCNVKLNDPEG